MECPREGLGSAHPHFTNAIGEDEASTGEHQARSTKQPGVKLDPRVPWKPVENWAQLCYVSSPERNCNVTPMSKKP